MTQSIYHIKTKTTLNEILVRLKGITVEEQPFIRPKHARFLGKIQGNSFKLITFNAPPMEFQFKIISDQLYFEYKKETLKPALKGLTYALMFPLFTAIWIYSLISKNFNWFGRIALGLTLILIFFISKMSIFIYDKFVGPNDLKFINELKLILDVDIEIDYR